MKAVNLRGLLQLCACVQLTQLLSAATSVYKWRNVDQGLPSPASYKICLRCVSLHFLFYSSSLSLPWPWSSPLPGSSRRHRRRRRAIMVTTLPITTIIRAGSDLSEFVSMAGCQINLLLTQVGHCSSYCSTKSSLLRLFNRRLIIKLTSSLQFLVHSCPSHIGI